MLLYYTANEHGRHCFLITITILFFYSLKNFLGQIGEFITSFFCPLHLAPNVRREQFATYKKKIDKSIDFLRG